MRTRRATTTVSGSAQQFLGENRELEQCVIMMVDLTRYTAVSTPGFYGTAANAKKQTGYGVDGTACSAAVTRGPRNEWENVWFQRMALYGALTLGTYHACSDTDSVVLEVERLYSVKKMKLSSAVPDSMCLDDLVVDSAQNVI
ncbi:hypothetical protein RRG08_027130 [Elysia crispata]|uniref:Uncharacterized protein n=1 Tax=Elysia crispata TaxID=231223 RepID=A0AAE1D565_9GAST|nr:hypothetical protein RRG08_027130 [Elysia crispata]